MKRIGLATFLAALNVCGDVAGAFVPKGSLVPARSSPDAPSSLGAASSSLPGTQEFWTWNGHFVHTEITPPSPSPSRPSLFGDGSGGLKKPAVLLIHGFGCSTTYWRATVDALSGAGYEVHALDLPGQGRSAKPGRDDGIEYSINLWAEVVDRYARENIGDGRTVVLGGNSLGSVVALAAASGDHATSGEGGDEEVAFLSREGRVGGICMFNCGVGMNSRNVANEPGRGPAERFLINFVLDVFDALIFKNRSLIAYVLDEVVTRDLLRDTLRNLYRVTPDRVDDELVESFYAPAKGEGSAEALSQIYTNDPGKTPMALHDMYPEKLGNLPMHLVWGDDDGVTPLEGGVGQFYKNLAEEQTSLVSFQIVPGGHVPFDDNPEESNASMLRWLEEVIEARSKTEEKKEQKLGLGLGLGWLIR